MNLMSLGRQFQYIFLHSFIYALPFERQWNYACSKAYSTSLIQAINSILCKDLVKTPPLSPVANYHIICSPSLPVLAAPDGCCMTWQPERDRTTATFSPLGPSRQSCWLTARAAGERAKWRKSLLINCTWQRAPLTQVRARTRLFEKIVFGRDVE